MTAQDERRDLISRGLAVDGGSAESSAKGPGSFGYCDGKPQIAEGDGGTEAGGASSENQDATACHSAID
jgi:hypothetical protein